MNAWKVLIAYFGSQVLIASSLLLRMRTISISTDKESLAAWLFWLTLAGFISIFAGYRQSHSRISAVTIHKPSRYPIARTWIIIPGSGLFLTFLVMVLNFDGFAANLLVGFGPFSLLIYFQVKYAWAIGYYLGIGKVQIYYWLSGFTSVFALVSTFLFVEYLQWESLNSISQTFILCSINSVFHISLIIMIRVLAGFKLDFVENDSFRFKDSLIQNAALFPATVIYGACAMAVSIFGGAADMTSYGFYSRLLVLALLVPSGLTYPVMNSLLKFSGLKRIFKTMLMVNILNIPMVLMILIYASSVLDFVSNKTLKVDDSIVLLIILTSIFSTCWICINAVAISDVQRRETFGRRMLYIYIPFSLLIVASLTALDSVHGPFLSSFLVYLGVSIFGINFLRRKLPQERT